MKVEIPKGQVVVTVAGNLKLKLSRALKKKMVLHFLTPQQSRRAEITTRSNCQNKAIHMVCGDLSKSTGEMSPIDFYFDFKRNYLAFKIKEEDADYAGMIERFEALHVIMNKNEWRELGDKIYTHRDATVKQFHDAFTDFCMVHSSRGNQFRHPEDYKLMLQDEFYKDLIKAPEPKKSLPS